MEDESYPEGCRGYPSFFAFVCGGGVQGEGSLFACQVHIFQGGLREVDDEAIGKLTYKHFNLHDEDAEMPLKWYECQPVVSKKLVVMHVQPSSQLCVVALRMQRRNSQLRSFTAKAGKRDVCFSSLVRE